MKSLKSNVSTYLPYFDKKYEWIKKGHLSATLIRADVHIPALVSLRVGSSDVTNSLIRDVVFSFLQVTYGWLLPV